MFFSLVNFSFVHCDFHLFKTLLVVLATEIHTRIGVTDPWLISQTVPCPKRVLLSLHNNLAEHKLFLEV